MGLSGSTDLGSVERQVPGLAVELEENIGSVGASLPFVAEFVTTIVLVEGVVGVSHEASRNARVGSDHGRVAHALREG